MFSFPDPVNEKAARTVAAVVVALAVAALVSGAGWLLVVLALGFWARVLTGPTLSPVGRFGMWFARRYLGEPRHVPGPPKRFAQSIGAALTTTAAVAALGFDARGVADVLLVLLIVAAGLEAFAGLCLGCRLFALLMRAGLVPREVCARCVG
jgi:hypothetical protein